MESRQFADRLKRLPAKEWLHVTLTVATPGPDGTGMHSSGMFILNPPYTLEPILRETMPYLVQVLGQDSGATFRIERGTQVTGTVGARGVEAGPRKPVGNARRASPLSGAGSLRLPGQPYGDGPRKREAGAPGGAGAGSAAGSAKGAAASGRPGEAAKAPAKKRVVPGFRYAGNKGK
jgi:23S rRNA (adenine2030-N6)-methyltransferase